MLESCALIYSDEPSTSRIWALLVTDLRCRPMVVNSLPLAFDAIHGSLPDVIVVDVTSRAVNGPEVCAALRERTGSPILLLTPVHNESHTLEAYQAGADDCLIKPVSPALFIAKMRVWLGRAQKPGPEKAVKRIVGDLVLDPALHELTCGSGRKVRLSRHEFRALHLFLGRPNQPVHNEELIEQVWGFHSAGDGALLKNLIYRLRQKIRPESGKECAIVTIPGGYMFRI